jgi:hypothetical protein
MGDIAMTATHGEYARDNETAVYYLAGAESSNSELGKLAQDIRIVAGPRSRILTVKERERIPQARIDVCKALQKLSWAALSSIQSPPESQRPGLSTQ